MKGRDEQLTYLSMAGVVAIVAVVALVLNSTGSLSGALSYAEDSNVSQARCSDTDPANYFEVAGTVRLRDKIYQDHCEGDYLVQQYCRSWTQVSHTRPLKCPKGCSEGICITG